jgi:hypothetical protein
LHKVGRKHVLLETIAYALPHISEPHPFFAQTPEEKVVQALELGHCDTALRVLQLESPQMMRGPQVFVQDSWSLEIHMAEKDPGGPLWNAC